MSSMSVPRVYLPHHDPAVLTPMVEGEEAHHLRQVLRARVGDRVAIFDGRGHEWSARVAALAKHAVTLDVISEITPVAEAAVKVTLAVGLLKGDQMDAVVRDATMLGVAAIVPMHTAHVTVPATAWQSGAAHERWQRVAVASAKQCQRAVVPVIHPVVSLDAVLAMALSGPRLVCVEPAISAQMSPEVQKSRSPEVQGTWRVDPPPAAALVLIGPEGGWAGEEIARMIAAGAQPLRLGPRTLRAETTPTVAIALLAATWGW